MKRRIFAAVAAVALAVVGAVTLNAYVGNADARAMAALDSVQVLVVAKPIVKGTPADQLTTEVVARSLPKVAVVPTAVSDLAALAGQVATTDLQPGEQVIGSRFADPASLADAQSAPVPSGLQEVSLQLASERALGGNLVPGDTVGVLLTVDTKTQLALHGILVSRVQGGLAAVPADPATTDEPAPMPDSSVMVTLALTAEQAEQVVGASENGRVWLSLEPAIPGAPAAVATQGKVDQ